MIELRVPAETNGRLTITRVGETAARYPGSHALQIVAVTRDDREVRRLTLGPEWRCDGGPLCLAALGEFGEVRLHRE